MKRRATAVEIAPLTLSGSGQRKLVEMIVFSSTGWVVEEDAGACRTHHLWAAAFPVGPKVSSG